MTVLRLGFQRDVAILILPRTLFVRIMKTKKETAFASSNRARHDAVSPETHANVRSQSHARTKRISARAFYRRAHYRRTTLELLLMPRSDNLSSKSGAVSFRREKEIAAQFVPAIAVMPVTIETGEHS